MINLLNDYNAVAHPKVLSAIAANAGAKFVGYGMDEACGRAIGMIQALIASERAAVHLLIGGTQTNLTAISAFLRPHEAVISAEAAHINIHETGAIEATGHKILTAPTVDGKIRPDQVRQIVLLHRDEHMVKPRLLFLSQSTEYGAVYTLAELKALRQVCDEWGLYLYIDGARLGYATMSAASDCGLADIARLADAFYIGGTKNGLLFGEALVLANPLLQTDFRYYMKQRGGLLAKGFLLGIQFEALFRDDLYFSLAGRANQMAAKIAQDLRSIGYQFETETVTNQIFPIVGARRADFLRRRILFETWNRANEPDESIRLVTTWETTDADAEAAIDLFRQAKDLDGKKPLECL